jgi:neutral trehalase
LNKKDFPHIHFYDQDFVDVYDRTWAWIADCWPNGGSQTKISKTKFFYYPEQKRLDFLEQVFSSFFLVYTSNLSGANGLTRCTLQEPMAHFIPLTISKRESPFSPRTIRTV